MSYSRAGRFSICTCFVVVLSLLAGDVSGELRKINFSPITSIIGQPVYYNEEPVMVDIMSVEYLDNLRLMVVTPDGYEYTGSLSEIQEALASKEDKEDDYALWNQFYETLDDIMIDKRSVVGTDQRHLQSPSSYPYTAMGQIEIGCTGTFIASRTVQTAGHCVHNRHSWHRYLDIAREKGCDPSEGKTHKWAYAITLKSWVEHSYASSDIAWIIYKTHSPVTMPMTSETPSEGTEIRIYGYPADLPNRCLYGTSCKLSQVMEKRLAYQCDTFGGNSGSAIYYMKEGKPTIIGVHGYGTENSVSGYNKGTRITTHYESIAKKVIAKYNGKGK